MVTMKQAAALTPAQVYAMAKSLRDTAEALAGIIEDKNVVVRELWEARAENTRLREAGKTLVEWLPRPGNSEIQEARKEFEE